MQKRCPRCKHMMNVTKMEGNALAFPDSREACGLRYKSRSTDSISLHRVRRIRNIPNTDKYEDLGCGYPKRDGKPCGCVYGLQR